MTGYAIHRFWRQQAMAYRAMPATRQRSRDARFMRYFRGGVFAADPHSHAQPRRGGVARTVRAVSLEFDSRVGCVMIAAIERT